MCGRFVQNLSWSDLRDVAGLTPPDRPPFPRFNIAPSTPIEVLRSARRGLELVPMF